MTHAILAISVGQFLGNGLDWATSNPWYVVGIFAVLCIGAFLLAGPAGPLAGGWLATVGYASLAALLTAGAAVAIGNIGSGPGGGQHASTDACTRSRADRDRAAGHRGTAG